MFNSKSKLIIDKIVSIIFMMIAILCASSIVFIVLFILMKGITPFTTKYADGLQANFWTFISSRKWIKYNSYGVLGILLNTLYLVLIASLIALPLSVLTSLFIVRIASKKISIVMQIVVELLAAIPSIVFGLFGMGFINPMVRDFAKLIGLQTAGGISGLSTVIVLIMMMLPTITMVTITSMRAVKKNQIEASLALGATVTQTNFRIVIGGAKSGIFAAFILGVGRALGEATAVSMVCGSSVEGPVFNIFSPTSTLTSTMMTSLHESNGIDYDIRFSVGIVLIMVILVTNILLNRVKRWVTRYEH